MNKYFANIVALDQYHDFFPIYGLCYQYPSVETFQISSREVERFLENKLVPFLLR